MLTESFVASTQSSGSPEKPTPTKDIGICVHNYRPLPAIRSTFKKSSTQENCLAVSSTHVFAAQADKNVVHVYNRERGNQEAVVPFAEKITSLALAGEYDEAGLLVLGTDGGRLILWEVCSSSQ